MRFPPTIFTVAATVLATASSAKAESSTIGVTVTSDRDADKFSDPKNMKYELNGTHTFTNGLIVGGSLQYNDREFSDRTRENLEGTVGYRLPMSATLSLSTSFGIGEHWRQNPDAEFPYYVLRVGTDLQVTKTVTWNVISFRYRDAINPSEHYNTPQVATGVSFDLNDTNSISAKIMRNWRDGTTSSTGISLGWRRKF
jgi:hypothetical protein